MSGSTSSVPVLVSSAGPLGMTPVDVQAGSQHTCALAQSGGIVCWGDGSHGQLGNGLMTGSSVPVDTVPSLAPSAGSFAAGAFHTCAVVTQGYVYCWGDNTSGQLGVTTTSPSEPNPQQVANLSTAHTVVVGDSHSCAVTTGGAVWCWGSNAKGQLGNGPGTDSSIPLPVVGLGAGAGVDGIAAGGNTTCVMMTSGRVKCWGENLGNGAASPSNVPVDVPTH
jgi:alpha-tubulin suppressor-like RCC1 family protein